MSVAELNSNAYSHFFILALEYYVSARASLLSSHTRITGNLLHHAVEMLLKGQLSKSIALEDLKDFKKFGHNLQKLWEAVKDLTSAEHLADFDAVITELDKFEKTQTLQKSVMFGF